MSSTRCKWTGTGPWCQLCNARLAPAGTDAVREPSWTQTGRLQVRFVSFVYCQPRNLKSILAIDSTDVLAKLNVEGCFEFNKRLDKRQWDERSAVFGMASYAMELLHDRKVRWAHPTRRPESTRQFPLLNMKVTNYPTFHIRDGAREGARNRAASIVQQQKSEGWQIHGRKMGFLERPYKEWKTRLEMIPWGEDFIHNNHIT